MPSPIEIYEHGLRAEVMRYYANCEAEGQSPDIAALKARSAALIDRIAGANHKMIIAKRGVPRRGTFVPPTPPRPPLPEESPTQRDHRLMIFSSTARRLWEREWSGMPLGKLRNVYKESAYRAAVAQYLLTECGLHDSLDQSKALRDYITFDQFHAAHTAAMKKEATA